MGVLAWNCIAIQLMYCRLRDMAEDNLVAIQKNCIVRNSGKRQGCLCRKTGSCVTTRRWARQQGERARARRASVLGRTGRAWRVRGGERQLGLRRRRAAAALGARQGARRLALGCALGVLGLFLARFDTVFS